MNSLASLATAPLAWADPDQLPALPRTATYLIALGLVAVWMILRVRILRTRNALRAEEGSPPLGAWRWLRWLADRTYSLHVLVAIALSLFAAAAVLTLNS